VPENICIYHKDCSDGKGAALAVWLKYRDDCLYHPAAHKEHPPYEVWDRNVILVDFCYSAKVMYDLSKVARSILVLDHHKTSYDDTKNLTLPNTRLYFDITKSGAAIAWNYFHRDSYLPDLIWHIQDRDLNTHRSSSTKAIVEGLKQYPDFRDWEPFLHGIESLQPLKDHGTNIIDFVNTEAQRMVKVPPRPFIEGHTVPLYNLPDFMVCDTLALALQAYPDAPFAASYYDKGDTRVYSLRSRVDGMDVGELAKKFGGGGHENSAGFTILQIHKVKPNP
jgi:hypothetical protein